MYQMTLSPFKYRPDDGNGSSEEDYLSKLAQSILKKDLRTPSPQAVQELPSAATSRSVPSSRDSVPRSVSPVASTPISSSSVPRPAVIPESRKSESGVSRDWTRKVDYYDERGNFLPGTILVFEDGGLGVYKETNTAKEYDIVYRLLDTGKSAPHGMPLANYTVEPIGRMTEVVLNQIVATNRWERDMVVFHLLKYKDRVHVPHVLPHEELDRDRLGSSETVSSWAVQKLTAAELNANGPPAPVLDKTTALARGRRLMIEFGPNQKWDAVYWGKDELGHVVAHNTHEKWSLMHLDLNRFKETMNIGEMVSQDTLKSMDRDFSGK
ncbi:hypothetical protein BH09SUM1_BH09SUM1_32340 [soil metagenome]